MLKKLFNFIITKQKLLLAFEYAIVIIETANKQKVEIDSTLIGKAQAMIISEFTIHDAQFLATNMIPNVMSIFEINME